MSYNKKIAFYFAVILLALGLVSLTGQAPPATAGNTGGLPPRETPKPQPPGHDNQDHKDDKGGPPAGAYIELAAPDLPAGAWTIVQWQDSSGGWHNVEGWQGWEYSSSRWWVHPKDFGSGPFRWLVTQGPGGPAVGVSPPFTLPGGAGQVVPVTVP